MAHDQSPDLIVMDMSLPEIDGWEATRRLKADPATRVIPIVALTAHAMASDRKKAMDAGCDDYHTKPVDFESLVRTLEAFLEARNRRARTANLVPASLSRNAEALRSDPQC
jgi:CheY-like chemotaxis protein